MFACFFCLQMCSPTNHRSPQRHPLSNLIQNSFVQRVQLPLFVGQFEECAKPSCPICFNWFHRNALLVSKFPISALVTRVSVCKCAILFINWGLSLSSRPSRPSHFAIFRSAVKTFRSHSIDERSKKIEIYCSSPVCSSVELAFFAELSCVPWIFAD